MSNIFCIDRPFTYERQIGSEQPILFIFPNDREYSFIFKEFALNDFRFRGTSTGENMNFQMYLFDNSLARVGEPIIDGIHPAGLNSSIAKNEIIPPPTPISNRINSEDEFISVTLDETPTPFIADTGQELFSSGLIPDDETRNIILPTDITFSARSPVISSTLGIALQFSSPEGRTIDFNLKWAYERIRA